MREWVNYYVNVLTAYTWPNGYPNFPCAVRTDTITESTSIDIKMLTFDCISLTSLKNLTLIVKARFVKSDKTILSKDLISIDLSSNFSSTMKKVETLSVSSFCVHEKVRICDTKESLLFQIGVKFKSMTDTSVKQELAVIYTIG